MKMNQDDYVLLLDKYQRDNLLWLLRLAHAIPELSWMCTGDWHCEVRYMLEDDDPDPGDPNENVEETKSRFGVA